MTVLSTSAHKKEEAIKTLKADHFIVSKDQEQMKVRRRHSSRSSSACLPPRS